VCEGEDVVVACSARMLSKCGVSFDFPFLCLPDALELHLGVCPSHGWQKLTRAVNS